MRSGTYDLAGSGLTFEIMCFESNTGGDRELPSSRTAQQPQDPLEQLDNPLSRQELEPTSRVTSEALYSEAVSGCTFSPRICSGIVWLFGMGN
jgi:hypothetical protein